MDRVRRRTIIGDRVGEEIRRQMRFLDGGHDPTRIVPGKDVDQHVQVVIHALRRAAEFRDVPRPHLGRAVRAQFGFHRRRMRRLPAPFTALTSSSSDPVHRRHRAQVTAFVQLPGPDLPDRQIRVPLGVDQREHRVPLRRRQRLTIIRDIPSRFRTQYRTQQLPVMRGARPADQRARRFCRHTSSAEFGECDTQCFVGGAGISVLSEIASKSPCSFPMISTTACDFANSRVNRAFSVRNRSASCHEPADFPER